MKTFEQIQEEMDNASNLLEQAISEGNTKMIQEIDDYMYDLGVELNELVHKTIT